MQVYLVTYNVPYESSTVMHVCDTYEMADRLATKMGKGARVEGWEVESDSKSEDSTQRRIARESTNGEADCE